jgi:hypothetical protein
MRERIEEQGFCGLDDGQISEFNLPLRLAPFMCLVWTAAGLTLGSPAVIAALVPFAVAGAILPGHPFDVVYNFGLRHLVKRPPLPHYGKRRRLACVAASVALTASALSFLYGAPAIGYTLGIMVSMGTLTNVITGICPPAAFAARVIGKVDCK